MVVSADVRVDNSINIDTSSHIHINLWGSEDTSDFKERLGAMLDSLPAGASGKQVLARVMSMIWADPSRPQNLTAFIPNVRDNIPHVRTEGGWEPRPEADVYPEMVRRACTELERKQDFELGYTPEGLEQLTRRGQHVRAAFDSEPSTLLPKEAASLIRPLLLASRLHLERMGLRLERVGKRHLLVPTKPVGNCTLAVPKFPGLDPGETF